MDNNIRQCFETRYTGGRLVEFDYSQLEIRVLAFLSGDEQLKEDLLSGVDVHMLYAKKLFGAGATQAQRRVAKQMSFQLQYGSGAANMAKKFDIDVSIAKKFIREYYNRYPWIKQYQLNVMNHVERYKKYYDDRTESGLPAATGTYKSITGKVYTFVEKDNPYKPGECGFLPTQMKNYEVQGLASEICAIGVGQVYRRVKAQEILLVDFVNTTHDSLLLDCFSEGRAQECLWQVKTTLQDVPKHLKDKYYINFDIPLPVDVKMGRNWGDMEKFDYLL